jgi:hypothetical protein
MLIWAVFLAGSAGMSVINAQTDQPVIICATTTASIKENKYLLPFPGMLIDHPLYLLKGIRDSIYQSFIRNPVKKIEFSIMQSDKFLNMAIFLSTQNKPDKIEAALEASYQSAQVAYTEIGKYKQLSSSCPPHLAENLEKSVRNHIDVVTEMEQDKPEADILFLVDDINRFATLLENVKKL